MKRSGELLLVSAFIHALGKRCEWPGGQRQARQPQSITRPRRQTLQPCSIAKPFCQHLHRQGVVSHAGHAAAGPCARFHAQPAASERAQHSRSSSRGMESRCNSSSGRSVPRGGLAPFLRVIMAASVRSIQGTRLQCPDGNEERCAPRALPAVGEATMPTPSVTLLARQLWKPTLAPARLCQLKCSFGKVAMGRDRKHSATIRRGY